MAKTINQGKLSQVNLGGEYICTDLGTEYLIEPYHGQLAAIVTKNGHITYNVTGVYNSGDDFAEIDMEKLIKLKALCDDLLKAK